MKTPEIIKKLRTMIGKLYSYQGNKVIIQDYQIDGPKLIIHTNAEDISFFLDNAEQWFDEMKPLDLALSPKVVQQVASVLPATTVVGEVNDMLLDMMKAVQLSPDRIPQAKAMADLGRTIHAGQRVQIDAAKVMLEASKRK